MDEQLIDMVEPKWRDAFRRLISTGETEEDFLEYLNQDIRCQEAVEKACSDLQHSFADLARELQALSGGELSPAEGSTLSGPDMLPDRILQSSLRKIEPEWRRSFRRFVETGDADEDFLRYLEDDPGGRQAVEEAFAAVSSSFDDLAHEYGAKAVTPERRGFLPGFFQFFELRQQPRFAHAVTAALILLVGVSAGLLVPSQVRPIRNAGADARFDKLELILAATEQRLAAQQQRPVEFVPQPEPTDYQPMARAMLSSDQVPALTASFDRSLQTAQYNQQQQNARALQSLERRIVASNTAALGRIQSDLESRVVEPISALLAEFESHGDDSGETSKLVQSFEDSLDDIRMSLSDLNQRITPGRMAAIDTVLADVEALYGAIEPLTSQNYTVAESKYVPWHRPKAEFTIKREGNEASLDTFLSSRKPGDNVSFHVSRGDARVVHRLVYRAMKAE